MLAAFISNTLALFFCWLFAQAAIHKFRSPAYYAQLVQAYPLWVGVIKERFTVCLIALTEMLLAVTMLVPSLRNIGFVGVALLLCGYALLMAWQIRRGAHDLSCGCAGPASRLNVGPALVARNLVCALLALLAIPTAGTGSGGPAMIVLSVLVAVFFVGVYLSSDQLIANAQAMAEEI